MELDFGKKITHEAFQQGDRTSIKVEYSIPVVISTKPEALGELMKCLELLQSGETNAITLLIKADPLSHEIKHIRKSYILEQK